MTQVRLLSTKNFNQWQLAKAEEARRLIELTVNAEPFQNAVRSAQFLETSLERADGTVTTNLSNEQILMTILRGLEEGSPADGIIGLKVVLQYRLFGAVGYASDGVIYSNTKYFNPWDPIYVAGHWMHEWMHVAGFHHAYHPTSDRSRSVPYLLGELLSEHAAPFVKLL